MTAELEFVVFSDWSEMQRVYERSSEFLKTGSLTDDSVYRCTMVICELAENGIKYGHFRRNGDVVAIRATIVDRTMTVFVSNPVGKATEANLCELDRTIQWVRSYQDPFEAYVGRMKAVSREPLEANKSGLGIARMAYEGRAALDFYLSDGNILTVTGVSYVERHEGDVE